VTNEFSSMIKVFNCEFFNYLEFFDKVCKFFDRICIFLDKVYKLTRFKRISF
jgi:hypothetical protein